MTQRIEVGIKLTKGAVEPKYQTDGSVGMDIEAALDAPVTLAFGERKLIDTGLAMEIPEGVEGNIRPRSGLCHKKGLFVFEGTIDCDYRGEIRINCINLGQEPVTIMPRERIAQIAFSPVLRAVFAVKLELSETARGEGGFGSTGTK